MRIFYIYDFSRNPKDCKPVATVAIDGPMYGVDICPTDKQFVKQRGRNNAIAVLQQTGRFGPETHRTIRRGTNLEKLSVVINRLLRFNVDIPADIVLVRNASDEYI